MVVTPEIVGDDFNARLVSRSLCERYPAKAALVSRIDVGPVEGSHGPEWRILATAKGGNGMQFSASLHYGGTFDEAADALAQVIPEPAR